MLDTVKNAPVNGLDLEALGEVVEAIEKDSSKGIVGFDVVTRWKGQTRSETTVDGFTLKATLHRAARTRVQLHIVGRGDIPPTSPLPVTIVVAGAQGSTLVKRPVHRHRHDDHRHHDDESSTGAL